MSADGERGGAVSEASFGIGKGPCVERSDGMEYCTAACRAEDMVKAKMPSMRVCSGGVRSVEAWPRSSTLVSRLGVGEGREEGS